MKQLPIYMSFILTSLGGGFVFGQNDSLNVESKEILKSSTEKLDSIKPKSKQGNLFIAGDLFSPVLGSFSDKKGWQAMLTYRVYKKWHLVAEYGREKNHYDELDWDINVDGNVYKFGFNWFISQDYENPSNGFYTGFRFALSQYKQTINAYPIRDSHNQVIQFASMPTADVSAYWVEILAGARVKLIHNFYADFSVRPEIYVGSKKQENLDPLVIPGYGRDVGPINFSIFWGLSYKLF